MDTYTYTILPSTNFRASGGEGRGKGVEEEGNTYVSANPSYPNESWGSENDVLLLSHNFANPEQNIEEVVGGGGGGWEGERWKMG